MILCGFLLLLTVFQAKIQQPFLSGMKDLKHEHSKPLIKTWVDSSYFGLLLDRYSFIALNDSSLDQTHARLQTGFHRLTENGQIFDNN